MFDYAALNKRCFSGKGYSPNKIAQSFNCLYDSC